jgi:hypothetical protein
MLQNLVMREGEDRTFTLYARDWANNPLSLTGATISWRVGKNPYNKDSSFPSFTKTGSILASASGQFTVAVSASDTQWREGDYRHQGWVTISGANTLAVEGRLRIQPWIQSG